MSPSPLALPTPSSGTTLPTTLVPSRSSCSRALTPPPSSLDLLLPVCFPRLASWALFGKSSHSHVSSLGGLDNSAGSYAWAVDASLGAEATYGLKITYDSNPEVFQYSFPFHIAKGAASSSAAAPATTAPAAEVPANQANVESTIYSTEMVTITSCAATVTDCPARSTVVSSTLKPITTGGAPAPSAPAPVASGTGNAPVPPQPQTTLTPAYPVGNGTTPGGGAIGTVTLKTSSSVAAGTGNIPAPTATGSVPVTANGAGRVAAGSVALIAGVMAAVFAL